MADLFIDFAELIRTRDDFGRIKDLLSHPLDTMAEKASRATEFEELRSKLADFGDEWDYGIGKLGEFSGEVSDVLDQIRTAFEDADNRLASGLEDAFGGQQ